MRELLLAALAIPALHAASIRGVVVEAQSGHPLARALVVVQPIAGTNAGPQSARSDVNGAFEIGPLAGGAYLVLAARRAFAPAQYGQKWWNAAGAPVVVDENGAATVTIRMQHYGAITGVISDENDVGLQEHEVVAYRNTRPPSIVARAVTDERGVYRIGGLAPGSYLVRTVGKRYDEGDYLPTFSRETSRVDEARPVDVRLDVETAEVRVRPFAGRLYKMAGRAVVYPPRAVTLTRVSDIGAETTVSDAKGAFQFPPAAPGRYELYAVTSPGERRRPDSAPLAAYHVVSLDRDRSDVRVTLGPMAELRLTAEDTAGQAIDARTTQVLYRRKDFSGEGKTDTLRAVDGRVTLAPGRYELALAPSTSYYAAGFSGPTPDSARRPPDGWNEVVLSGAAAFDVKFVLSPRPAAVHGVAQDAARAPAAGVPVFLEPYDPESRRRSGDVRAIRADTRGRFEFYGLAPGHYRLLSTFEFQSPDEREMDAANPRLLKLEEGQDQAADLEVYVIR